MKPVEKIVKVSRCGNCRMIRKKCQMRQDAGRHFRRKNKKTHVGHVLFGDQLVRPTLSDCYLSVCPVSLSVTLVYCGQTVGLRAE